MTKKRPFKKASLYCADCGKETEHRVGKMTICIPCEKKRGGGLK